MNPLSLGHLIADFLLQPRSLVKWKKKSISGMAVHTLIHFLTMALLLYGNSRFFLSVAALIAIVHGIIDWVKVRMQKQKSPFGKIFLMDQLVHWIILTILLVIFPVPAVNSGIYFFLFFAAFAVAQINLSTKQKLPRVLLVSSVFLLFAMQGLVSEFFL